MVALPAFALVFTLVVLVHEFGHFLAARRFGVKVYEFSIGFPFSPRLFTLFRHKETVFTVRLVPLGGFVSFSQDHGEDRQQQGRQEKERKTLDGEDVACKHEGIGSEEAIDGNGYLILSPIVGDDEKEEKEGEEKKLGDTGGGESHKDRFTFYVLS